MPIEGQKCEAWVTFFAIQRPLHVDGGASPLAASGYEGSVMAESSLHAAVPCQICGDVEAQLPHMNCANIGERV